MDDISAGVIKYCQLWVPAGSRRSNIFRKQYVAAIAADTAVQGGTVPGGRQGVAVPPGQILPLPGRQHVSSSSMQQTMSYFLSLSLAELRYAAMDKAGSVMKLFQPGLVNGGLDGVG